MKVYPSVGVKKNPPVHISVNFGQQPFMYDIDGMVKVRLLIKTMARSLSRWLINRQKEKAAIHSEISLTSIANIQPSLDETSFLQELVAQFLAHDGYVETARAFAEEVAAESAALENGRETQLKKYEVEEDVEAINRQSMSRQCSSLYFIRLANPYEKSELPFSKAISIKLSNTPMPTMPMFCNSTLIFTLNYDAANSWR